MSQKFKAVGVHVFAGGFTQGVKQVFDVETQYEGGDFGRESVEQLGVNWVKGDGKWPVDKDCAFCYGNPRCTAFSTCTAGHATAHGAFAPQTIDILQLMNHAVGNYDVICFESVQQAYSVGKPLLDQIIRDQLSGKGYRVAHVMLNSASFDNPQNRKRYFFVAYRDNLVFNCKPPDIGHRTSIADAMWKDFHRETRPCHLGRKDVEYDRDCYPVLPKDLMHTLKNLPSHTGLNWLCDNYPEGLHEKLFDVYIMSEKRFPFMGAFSIHRGSWERSFPTIHSAAGNFIHPWHHRPYTLGELSRAMGWDDWTPKGPRPIAQLAKGVVPTLGKWLAQQVHDCLSGKYAKSDDIAFRGYKGYVEQHDASGQLEKVIDMTHWVAPLRPLKDYPDEIRKHTRVFGVNNNEHGEPLCTL